MTVHETWLNKPQLWVKSPTWREKIYREGRWEIDD
jgi:hypothetical protein